MSPYGPSHGIRDGHAMSAVRALLDPGLRQRCRTSIRLGRIAVKRYASRWGARRWWPSRCAGLLRAGGRGGRAGGGLPPGGPRRRAVRGGVRRDAPRIRTASVGLSVGQGDRQTSSLLGPAHRARSSHRPERRRSGRRCSRTERETRRPVVGALLWSRPRDRALLPCSGPGVVRHGRRPLHGTRQVPGGVGSAVTRDAGHVRRTRAGGRPRAGRGPGMRPRPGHGPFGRPGRVRVRHRPVREGDRARPAGPSEPGLRGGVDDRAGDPGRQARWRPGPLLHPPHTTKLAVGRVRRVPPQARARRPSDAGRSRGGRTRTSTQAYGSHPVSFESHLLPMERIVALWSRAGLAVTARLTQEPGNGSEANGVATLLARKSPLP